MRIHYLEIVTNDVAGVCAAYEASLHAEFGDPEPRLGNARVAEDGAGGLVAVRTPMHEAEEPTIRPYWLVDDIQAAFEAALAAGAEAAHPPLEIEGFGTFAIYISGGGHHALWQT